MSAWNPAGAPGPGRRRARRARRGRASGTDLVVLDPTSPTEFVMRRPALWAVAQSQPWRPPFESDRVLAAFERSVAHRARRARRRPARRRPRRATRRPRARRAARAHRRASPAPTSTPRPTRLAQPLGGQDDVIATRRRLARRAARRRRTSRLIEGHRARGGPLTDCDRGGMIGWRARRAEARCIMSEPAQQPAPTHEATPYDEVLDLADRYAREWLDSRAGASRSRRASTSRPSSTRSAESCPSTASLRPR